ncbi:hypothetical protein L467_05031 [Klebsiella pneumoniae BIDMC 31]|nr:hypothetical protein L467_05031 [Klebsiella pneumoniae BIDMC 31]
MVDAEGRGRAGNYVINDGTIDLKRNTMTARISLEFIVFPPFAVPNTNDRKHQTVPPSEAIKNQLPGWFFFACNLGCRSKTAQIKCPHRIASKAAAINLNDPPPRHALDNQKIL